MRTATSPAWAQALPYVPRTLVDALARRGDGRAGWIEPLDGTLLVADVSGFTPLSEALSRLGSEGAERLTAIMNGYFERLLDIAAERGGDNLKFGGDALCLAFTGPGHADRAVAAALAMQRSTGDVAAIRIGATHQRLAMSIGVHTARFWFATAGTSARMQHLLLGGEAARLAATEGAAERGEVAVTAATRAALTDADVDDLDDRLVVRRSTDVRVAPSPPVNLTPALGDALLPYLPPRVAESVRADEIDLRGTGDHRRVAVLFVGLRGVNELVDRDGADVAFAEVQAYVQLLLELLDRHHGYLAGNDIDPKGTKFICLFGAPVAAEDDAAAALRFTADLLDAWAARGSPLIHQVGINLGSVFAGDAGSARRRDYTIIGDHVNLAARLMGVAAPGEAAAAAWIESGLDRRILAPDDPVTVKGKSEPVPIGRLQPGARWEALLPAGEVGAPTTLVGRDTELAAAEGPSTGARVARDRPCTWSGSRARERRHWSRQRWATGSTGACCRAAATRTRRPCRTRAGPACSGGCWGSSRVRRRTPPPPSTTRLLASCRRARTTPACWGACSGSRWARGPGRVWTWRPSSRWRSPWWWTSSRPRPRTGPWRSWSRTPSGPTRAHSPCSGTSRATPPTSRWPSW